MNADTPSEDDERDGMLRMMALAFLIDAPEGLDTEQVAHKTKRDYDSDPDRQEVTAALDRLARKKLIRLDGERWHSTPAALQARVYPL